MTSITRPCGWRQPPARSVLDLLAGPAEEGRPDFHDGSAPLSVRPAALSTSAASSRRQHRRTSIASAAGSTAVRCGQPAGAWPAGRRCGSGSAAVECNHRPRPEVSFARGWSTRRQPARLAAHLRYSGAAHAPRRLGAPAVGHCPGAGTGPNSRAIIHKINRIKLIADRLAGRRTIRRIGRTLGDDN